MAQATNKRLRALWLQVHKWIGLTLAILIIPICLTGSALVWHDWLDAKLEPQRYASYGEATLSPDQYVSIARQAIGQEGQIASMRMGDEGRPVVVTATKPLAAGAAGRPERTNLWLDPTNGRVIEKASASSGLVQVMHVLHGSLMWPGWGRALVGWVGAFMFISCLTGLWLWWPLRGSFTTGLRWRRRNTVNANLHYLTGFWVLIPLAMLSFTGAWISFPKVFGAFEPRPVQAPVDRSRTIRAMPLQSPQLALDEAIAAAREVAEGRLASISWPTDQKAEWKISLAGNRGPVEISVADGTGTATAPPPRPPETLARKMRRWHDGTGMGPAWQIAIFLGGIIPVLLSVTGIVIWWRARKPRQKAKDYRRLAAQP